MTSQRFTERTARTERTDFSPIPRRAASTVRRGLKKRGVLPSFGDMILPIVGVFAVLLLVLAGRQFFINGLNSSPGIASTRAYAEAPAILAELERSRMEAEPAAKVSEPVSMDSTAVANDNNNQENKEEEDLFALAVAVQTKPLPPVNQTAAPAAKKTSAPASTAKKQTQTPAAKTQTSKQSGSSSVSDKQWRVQVGAYTTKAGAQDAANKIKKAGYNATVYSNPASKHFKVWVAGGADKKAADSVVNAMQKLGYKGSFSFPPAK
ncbi:MAG: SPOR domain-containing protein [Synergistaceae bacterium]|nr:SPOR domain-containing protein [Synergistaceae bacterium]